MMTKVLRRLALLEAELAALDPAGNAADRVAAMARALREAAGAMAEPSAAATAGADAQPRRAAG